LQLLPVLNRVNGGHCLLKLTSAFESLERLLSQRIGWCDGGDGHDAYKPPEHLTPCQWPKGSLTAVEALIRQNKKDYEANNKGDCTKPAATSPWHAAVNNQKANEPKPNQKQWEKSVMIPKEMNLTEYKDAVENELCGTFGSIWLLMSAAHTSQSFLCKRGALTQTGLPADWSVTYQEVRLLGPGQVWSE
jgi:hypothetical protein